MTWQLARSLGGPVTAIAFHPREAGLVYAYVHQAGVGLMRSPDAGRAWKTVGFFSGVETPVIALAVGPGDGVAVATVGADVSRTRDGGRVWEKLLDRGRPVVQGR